MSSDPFSFSPPKALGSPTSRWRAIRRDDGSLRIDRQVIQGREWVEQTTEQIRWEIAQGTHAGAWLQRMRDLGLPG